MSTIGFSWSDGTTDHYFYFYKHFDRVGIQGVYNFNGATEKTDIVYYNFNTNSVEIEYVNDGGIKDATGNSRAIKEETYYDMQGRKVEDPTSGFYIKRTVFDDGTVECTKTAVKE